MKKVSLGICVNLLLICVSTFASFPPQPAPGVSCKATYNPITDLNDFCGCYQQQQQNNCTILKEPINCAGDPDGIVFQTHSAIQMLYHGSLVNFCTSEVGQLNAHGDPAMTTQNCEDDVGYIIGTLSGETSACTGHWSTQSSIR